MAAIGTTKYVMCVDPQSELEYPILFPFHVWHHTFAPMNPVSAGFVSLDPLDGWQAFGKSVGLGIESREQDTMIIQRSLGQTIKAK